MNKDKAILILDQVIKESLYLMETFSSDNKNVIQESYMLQPKFHRNPEVLETLVKYIAESIYGEDTIIDPKDGTEQDSGINQVDNLINNLNDKTEKIHKIIKYSDNDENYQKTMALLYTLSKAKEHNIAKDKAWKDALLNKYDNLSPDQEKELRGIIDNILIDNKLKEDEENLETLEDTITDNDSDEINYDENDNDLESKFQTTNDDIDNEEDDVNYEEGYDELESKLSGE